MTPEEIAAKVFACVSSDGSYVDFRDEDAANIIHEALTDQEAIVRAEERERIAASIEERGKGTPAADFHRRLANNIRASTPVTEWRRP